MNYYNEIKSQLLKNEINRKVKDYSKNRGDLETYYNVGKLLVEAQGGESRANYGNKLIKEYSQKLKLDFNISYSERSLRCMRQFYIMLKDNIIWQQVAAKLSWSHFIELLPIKDTNEVNYYINQTISLNLGRNELRKRIKNKEYKRLSDITKLKLIENEETSLMDLVKEPIIIENPNNIKIYKEITLHKLIMEKLFDFLKELGEGFTFVGNEYPIKIGNTFNYIDFLLFNIKFNSYVIIELKIGKLRKENIGQIMTYMNYIDKHLKTVNQDKTIGIILCHKNDRFIMEYCSDNRIISREYILTNIK